jgi:hypothetical protein
MPNRISGLDSTTPGAVPKIPGATRICRGRFPPLPGATGKNPGRFCPLPGRSASLPGRFPPLPGTGAGNPTGFPPLPGFFRRNPGRFRRNPGAAGKIPGISRNSQTIRRAILGISILLTSTYTRNGSFLTRKRKNQASNLSSRHRLVGPCVNCGTYARRIIFAAPHPSSTSAERIIQL